MSESDAGACPACHAPILTGRCETCLVQDRDYFKRMARAYQETSEARARKVADLEKEADELRQIVAALAAWRRCDIDPHGPGPDDEHHHDHVADIADAALDLMGDRSAPPPPPDR